MRFASAREAAQQYIDLGFRVVPLYGVSDAGCACQSPECKPRDWGKHEPPESDGLWKDGAEFAPSAFDEGSNIAIAMGPWGGSDDWLVALDVDGDVTAARWFMGLPETLTQTTPRGVHLVYAVPAYTPLGNWVDVFLDKPHGEPSLDLRYARGRIVTAPSRGYGGTYAWREMREPARLPEAAIEQILARRHERGLPVLPRWDRGSKRP